MPLQFSLGFTLAVLAFSVMFQLDLVSDSLDHESSEDANQVSGLSLPESQDPLDVSMCQEVSCGIGD